MTMDFPTPTGNIKTLLYADDISFYTQTDTLEKAEQALQLYLDEVYDWGQKWKFNFSPNKSSATIFTHLHNPGNNPLLFIHGHRIRLKTSVKFLGIIFDRKLLWKDQIDATLKHCYRLKNLFSAITSTKVGPSTKTLMLFFSSLVKSKLDYGLIAYGTASTSNLRKIDVAVRTILRTILGSRISTPRAALCIDLTVAPLKLRRRWLSLKYLINISSKPNNSTYTTAKYLFLTSSQWPKFRVPCLIEAI